MLKCDSKSSCLTLSHLCLLCAARAESDRRLYKWSSSLPRVRCFKMVLLASSLV